MRGSSAVFTPKAFVSRQLVRVGDSTGADAPEESHTVRSLLITAGVIAVLGYWLAPIAVRSLASQMAHEAAAVTW